MPKVRYDDPEYRSRVLAPKPLVVHVIAKRRGYKVMLYKGSVVSVSTDPLGVHIDPESPLGCEVIAQAKLKLRAL